jgi:4-hydroxythreonine-4-phosphate dehydrogenase
MIFVTLGEPFSVNCEVLWHLRPQLTQTPVPLILVGSYWQWQAQNPGLDDWSIPNLTSMSSVQDPGIYFWDFDDPAYHQDASQMPERLRGSLALSSLLALQQANFGRKLAFVTAPINKHTCQQAGFSFPGQTEYFENLAGEPGIMILAGPKLKVGLVTNHIPLSMVSQVLSLDLVLAKIGLLRSSLQAIYGMDEPRIAVVGLNPHCGDNGLFGHEDERLIRPAVDQARRHQWDVTGPLPADTVFYRAYHGQFDGVLAMYHDQGLGPLKTVHFDNAVNITGGLPFLRVSPDHGPAADLFGQNTASRASFAAAFEHAFGYFK